MPGGYHDPQKGSEGPLWHGRGSTCSPEIPASEDAGPNEPEQSWMYLLQHYWLTLTQQSGGLKSTTVLDCLKEIETTVT